MYKMVDISKKSYGKNDIEVIVVGNGTLWLNKKHLEEKLGHKTLPVITNKCDPLYKKHRYELVDKPKKQPKRRFLRSDLALKVIMNFTKDKSCNLKRNLGFRWHDVINTIEQTLFKSIKEAFEGKDMQTKCSVLGYRIDLYLHKHKFATEVDELWHADRTLSNEIERQKALENNLIACLLELILMTNKFQIYFK